MTDLTEETSLEVLSKLHDVGAMNQSDIQALISHARAVANAPSLVSRGRRAGGPGHSAVDGLRLLADYAEKVANLFPALKEQMELAEGELREWAKSPQWFMEDAIKEKKRAEKAEAEVQRLREALEKIAAYPAQVEPESDELIAEAKAALAESQEKE